LPWAPNDLFLGSSLISLFVASSPNTDIKVGMGGTKVREVDWTMLGLRVLGERRPLGWFGPFVLFGKNGGNGLVVGLGNSRSYFLDGKKVLGIRSEENALFNVGLSAF
jgi:hypothetical protein